MALFQPDGGVVAGGISYTAPSFTYGTQQAVNGGFSFDLPLATVQAFTNNALSFSANNSANAQGFLQGVLNSAQSNVNRTADRAYDYQTTALGTLESMQGRALSSMEKFNKRNAQAAISVAAMQAVPSVMNRFGGSGGGRATGGGLW